jgi:hypothetical protein
MDGLIDCGFEWMFLFCDDDDLRWKHAVLYIYLDTVLLEDLRH